MSLICCLADGNGFKTSTMRLGADVLVFSRSRGKSGKRLWLWSSFIILTYNVTINILEDACYLDYCLGFETIICFYTNRRQKFVWFVKFFMDAFI